MVQRHVGVATWILDIPFTQEVLAIERQFLVQYWISNNNFEMNVVINNIRKEGLLDKMRASGI